MKIKYITLSFVLLGFAQLQTSCIKDKTRPPVESKCDSVSYSYSMDILPILLSSCANGLGSGTGCHDAWISDYGSLKAHISSGTFQNEVLILKTMPVINNTFGISPLTDEELTKVDCWIQSGAPKN
jgi:hypothetical protein